MSMFLSQQELFELTGYRRAADQIRWLQEWQVPYYIQRQGRPVVRRDATKPVLAEPAVGVVR